MLRGLPEHVRECYIRAAESREKAGGLPEGDLRDQYLEMERRWTQLAQSFEFVESLQRFLVDKADWMTQE